jgi:hypothetical protein
MKWGCGLDIRYSVMNCCEHGTEPHNQLTPWSWALLQKPPVAQTPKIFPAFYGTRSFIVVFTWALQLSRSWASWMPSVPPHLISLRLDLLTDLFPSGFPTKILYAFLFAPMRVTWTLCSHKNRTFLTSWETVSISRKNTLYGVNSRQHK